MAGVMPKIGLYLFLSLICLMINLSVFFTIMINDENQNIDSFMGESIYKDQDLLTENEDADLGNFAFATGGSFVPFFSLIPIATLGEGLPIEMLVITGLVIGIISALQIFLLLVIVLNLAPKILGSGFDV